MSPSQRGPRIAFALTTLLTLLVNPASAYAELSNAALRSIPNAGGALHPHTGSLLSPILIPRVPGTAGSAAVQKHIVDFFERELPDWRLEWHNSTSRTPATGNKDVPFANLVFTRDPPWVKGVGGDVGRLALVAHYDSLHQPEGFVGATDSAVPCAVLMQVARGIDAALTRKWSTEGADEDDGLGNLDDDDNKGVQIILLDGEEAWATWSETDSLYGARALAEKWEAETYSGQSRYKSALESIKLFVLLDLLGAVDPHVPSYFAATHWAYRGMASVEKRLRNGGLLATQAPQMGAFLPESEKKVEQFRQQRGFIADDHIPFMRRGVPILHIIPTPFPVTWHTMDDDANHLDVDSIEDWAKIMTGFAAEWMELDEYMMMQSPLDGEEKEKEKKTKTNTTTTRDRSEL
ncbi:glutaminyl-peptide cyclotransferase [Xylariaceae sp. FL0255]|nr:glutaminyl-peptide cyclotransferase [Xylariaceae sp. FL0255]